MSTDDLVAATDASANPQPVPDHDDSDEQHEELRVTFYPPLFLQRRIWILDILRNENITKLLDVGCGEGQLLAVLCQPAPWLTPPPETILPIPEPVSPSSLEQMPPSPTYNDEIPNLHVIQLFGLDIASDDLAFAVQGIVPPQVEVDLDSGSTEYRSHLTNVGLRWEELEAKVWKGGFEVINEEFVNIECIVSTEVIEHLPPEIVPAFAPTLLGIYHPRIFLVTTPSYTFNARFTAPTAPASARQGYPDPTGRTDRIFRHHDHKFEWTADEFKAWCEETAGEWGYEVQVTTIGRALEADDWGRDAELGGATSVALFRRIESFDMKEREERGRTTLMGLKLPGEEHELLAEHRHLAHAASRQPKSLGEIADGVREKMEEFREAFMRVEELWFERDIAVMCGGWIEILVRAVEESEALNLKRDGEDMKKSRSKWVVELVGGVAQPMIYWANEEGDQSVDHIPQGWSPRECGYSSEEGGSTGVDGDVSSEDGGDDGPDDNGAGTSNSGWIGGSEKGTGWGKASASGWETGNGWNQVEEAKAGVVGLPDSTTSSTAGWDGDKSDDTTF